MKRISKTTEEQKIAIRLLEEFYGKMPKKLTCECNNLIDLMEYSLKELKETELKYFLERQKSIEL